MKVDSVSSLTISQNISKKNAIGKSGPSRAARTDDVSDSGASSSAAVSGKATVSFDRNSAAVLTGLSSAERAYFAKLFPDASAQIKSHSTTYSPGGAHSQVDLGQIINRKV